MFIFMILDSTLESNVISFDYRRNKICHHRNIFPREQGFFYPFLFPLPPPLLKLGTKLLLHTPGCGLHTIGVS